ncbi:glycosyltransferase [Tepidibacter thalassicus]|uniref:Glycosyltransferase involved in cell wall bisynthesis n=1 Tax=Tepidibacter thalassicus DSM 15285 TaxID=1123350 RepID=A0A1M5TD18_9FIRM|nr:glycosyltransferase [Tepidibacter thalassicus]SHH48520.1 Glycosyltransferase involved in cell wall bisynthesis [Tepidibacter thalassicus DSM 15285]
MINVIHVISDTNIGGAGVWILNFLREFNRDKYLVKVIVPKGSLLVDKISKVEIEVIEVEGMKDKSFDIKIIKKLCGILKKEKCDILHTHASISARIAGKMAGVRSIIHTKHCIDNEEKNVVKKSIKSYINRFISDRIIAVSEAVKNNLIVNGIPEEKIICIHNGIKNLKEIRREEKNKIRKELGIGLDDIVVGIVARLEEVKGHEYFIKAAKSILQKNNSVKFIIVGSGSRELELKELTEKMQIEEYVIFTGYVENIENIINIVDINVITSISEALCISLIEGMSLGKPSVGTKIGGIPEVIIDNYNGFLVPVRDSESLAIAILKLIEDEELRNYMGKNAKKLMEEKFTVYNMTKKIEKLYDELINN